MVGQQRIVVPFAGHAIGEGFNSETVERVGTGLNVAQVGEDPVASGQDTIFRFRMLTSQSSLEESLNFGASVEARYGLFSGSANMSFAQSNAVNSSSTYIVASCFISNALTRGSGFTPNETADRLIRAGDPKGFKLAFGDRYTQALQTGGEFHALVRVTSSDTKHQQRISASLNAELNGLFASGGFQASLETASQDTSSHTEVNVEVHQTGGVGDEVQIPGTEANRIRDHMNRFASAAHEHPRAYRAELLTYDTLALPFPSFEEMEDRRRVLEDCLARRQVYWTAISDLTFAQTEDATLIFEDLPSPEELVGLQNAFRRILGELMTHARGVANGTILPVPFVAEGEPPLPRFRRRTANRFASWWVRRNDPDLFQDERFLVGRIANEASKVLVVPVEEASPETVERAAGTIDRLDVSIFATPPSSAPLGSLASLPNMIDAPLRKVFAVETNLEDLSGLETFSRLEDLELDNSRNLSNIRAIASVAGLRRLRLNETAVEDLSPLRGLNRLEWLSVAGSRIESLAPLEGLDALERLSIANLPSPRPGLGQPVLLDNPILDARALDKVPHLANLFTSADRLRLTLFDNNGQEPLGAGLATRVGDTHRFRFAPDAGGTTELVLLGGLFEWRDPIVFTEPVVMSGLHFPERGELGIAAAKPNESLSGLPVTALAGFFDSVFHPEHPEQASFLVEAVAFAVGQVPRLFVEAESAS